MQGGGRGGHRSGSSSRRSPGRKAPAAGGPRTACRPAPQRRCPTPHRRCLKKEARRRPAGATVAPTPPPPNHCGGGAPHHRRHPQSRRRIGGRSSSSIGSGLGACRWYDVDGMWRRPSPIYTCERHARGARMEGLTRRLDASLLLGGALTAGGLFVGQSGARWVQHGQRSAGGCVLLVVPPPPLLT